MLYKDLFAKIALRVGAVGSIKGSNTAAIEAAYNDPLFGSAQIANPAFPFAAMRDSILFTEQKIVQKVAANAEHPLRAFILSETVPLANSSKLPQTDVNGKKVFGVHGAITDDGKILEQTDPREVQRINRLKTSVLKKNYYLYAWDGLRLIHTRQTVIIEVCVWDRAAQAALLPAGEMLFPDALEETYICGAVSYNFRADEAPENTKQYLNYFMDSLRTIEGGGVPQNADFS